MADLLAMNRGTMSTADEMTYDDLLRFLEEHQELVIDKLRRAGMFEPYFRRWALPPPPRSFVVPGVKPRGAQSEAIVQIRVSGSRSARRIDL
jgi:hypothetical protein